MVLDAKKKQGTTTPKHLQRPQSLKDQPSPVSSNALLKKKEQELEDRRRMKLDRNNSMKISNLDPSIISQPRIDKEKKIEEEETNMERKEQGIKQKEQEDNMDINDNNRIRELIMGKDKNDNKTTVSNQDEKVRNNQGQRKVYFEEPVQNVDENNSNNKAPNDKNLRHIPMFNNQEKYDIVRELSERKCDITLGQLLDESPKLRSELMKTMFKGIQLNN